MTDDDRTPPHTPSAMLKLGLEACPACDRRGVTMTGVQCFYCQGGRLVSETKAKAWRQAHPGRGQKP